MVSIELAISNTNTEVMDVGCNIYTEVVIFEQSSYFYSIDNNITIPMFW